jgi:hypothetical protein
LYVLQKFARLLASSLDIIVDGLPRLFRHFKPDGPTGFDPLIELSGSLHFSLEALITIRWPI